MLRLVLALTVLAAGTGASAQGFVTSQGSKLLLDGREYRAIGVNVPHLSQAYNGTWHHWHEIYGTREKMREAAVEAVLDAARHNIAFIRFFAGPGYPKGAAELYYKDRAEYWRVMDELLALCRQHNVKLVPCLNILRWHSEHNELVTAILDPASKTHAAAYGYVEEFVSRYKNDPNVLMWELENELFLHSDVEMEGRPAPPRGVYPEGAQGIRDVYSMEDSLRFEMIVQLYRDMTAFIKELDPNHLVTSGDAGPREESMCRRETFPDFKWRKDTLREHLSNLLESQPEPLDVFSIHVYGSFQGREAVGGLEPLDFLRARVRAMHAAQAPVFIGELGQTNPNFPQDPEANWTRAAIDTMQEEGVSLAAIWVWHFRWQDKDFNIPSGAAQPLLMQRVGQFNAEFAGR